MIDKREPEFSKLQCPYIFCFPDYYICLEKPMYDVFALMRWKTCLNAIYKIKKILITGVAAMAGFLGLKRRKDVSDILKKNTERG